MDMIMGIIECMTAGDRFDGSPHGRRDQRVYGEEIKTPGI
jgi:hypothetical protein